MKTPDEIKKGLKCCSTGKCEWDNGCPYMSSRSCAVYLKADALAYNQQLEAQNAEQAERIQQLEETVSEKEKVIAELSGKIGRLEAKRKQLLEKIELLDATSEE